MYLTSNRLKGSMLPPSLPAHVREEVELAMATLASRDTAAVPTAGTLQPQLQHVPQQQIMQPSPSSYQMPMMTGAVQPQMTGMPPYQQQPQQQQQQQYRNLIQQVNFQTPIRTGIAPPLYQENKPRLGNQDFASKMMPNQASTPNLLSSGGSGNSGAISWRISPEEKQRYREIFYAWNTPGEQYMSGDVATQVLMQSQLSQNDLMKIWSLADRENRGSLDVDEFAIAMHLIYRKLNNFEIPSVLPPELAPPSNVLKKFVVGHKQPTSPSPPLQQQQQQQFARSPSMQHYEDNSGYVSSARRKGPVSRFTSASAARPRYRSYEDIEEEDQVDYDREPELDYLRSQIADMKRTLDDLNAASRRREQDEYGSGSSSFGGGGRYSVEELKEKIRKTQQELTAAARSNPASAKYFENTETLLDLLETQKTLQDEIQYLCNRDIPVLARQLRGAAAELRDTKVRFSRKHDGSQDYMAFIEPTGPGGIVTESDRVRAKAKAMMAARKAGTSSTRDASYELKKAEQEKEDIDRQADMYERDMEKARDSLRDLRGDLRYLSTLVDSKPIIEKKRFEKGQDLSYELRRFIEQLDRDVSLYGADDGGRYSAAAPSPSSTAPAFSSMDRYDSRSSLSAQSPSTASSARLSPTPSRPRTADEIKKEAERRVQERLAALQIRRTPTQSPKPAPKPEPSVNEEEMAAQRMLNWER